MYHDLPPRVIVNGIHLMTFGANTSNIAQRPILFTLKLRHKNGVFNLVK